MAGETDCDVLRAAPTRGEFRRAAAPSQRMARPSATGRAAFYREALAAWIWSITASAARPRSRHLLRLLSAPSSLHRRAGLGGAHGNAYLTSLVGATLLVLLAVEGATIPTIHRFLSVHIFVGMLLLGPVTLKLASTGYRFVRYYTGDRDYVRLGPPQALMRFLVAPVLVISTITLFASGVLLLVEPQRGMLLLLHKASFIVWFGAMSIHVLAYAIRAGRNVLDDFLRRRSAGRLVRLSLAAFAIGAGAILAAATYPLAGPWLH